MHPMPKDIRELPIRIVLVSPPADVTFAVQRGKDELVSQLRSTGADVAFDVTIGIVQSDGQTDFRGPFVQGPRGGRFVYVNSGTLAGDAAAGWTRRAKIALGGISAELIAALDAKPKHVLRARIAGTAKDGKPAAASVPLLTAWELART